MPPTFCLKHRVQLSFACFMLGLLFIQCRPKDSNQKVVSLSATDPESAVLTELDSLFESRDFLEAIEVSRSFLANNKATGLNSGLIMIKLYQALNYEEKEDSSNRVFTQIISFAENELSKGSGNALKGKAYLSKAKILQDLDLYDSSTVYLNKVREYLPKSYADEYAYSYILSTKVAYYNYENEEAKSYLEEADKLKVEATLSDRNLTLIDNWYCLILEWDGELEKAIKHSENILTRFSKKNILSDTEEKNLLDTYQNLGTIYTSKGDIVKGINYYTRALTYETNKLEPDSLYIASLLNNVGFGLMSQYDFPEAISYLNRSNRILSVVDENTRRTKIETYLHLSFCYQEFGKNDSALYFSHLALELQKNSLIDLDYTYLNIATAHYANQNYQKAIDTINLSIAKAIEAFGTQHKLTARSYFLLGKILEAQGRFKEALEVYQEVLISSSRNFSDKRFTHNPEISLVFNQKDILKYFEKKIKVLIHLSEQESSTASYLETSWETNLTALQIIDHLRKNYSDDLSKFQLLSNANPIYEMGLQTAALLDEGRQDQILLEQAFKISEQGKSMILQDNMRSAFALQSPEIPEVLKRKEDSLRINIAFYEQRINTFKNKAELKSYDSTQYKNAQRIFLNSEEAYANLLKSIEKKFPDYLARKRGPEATSPNEIFDYLDSTQLTLIEYFWGEKAIYAFRLHEGRISMLEIPKDKQLADEIESWRNSVSDATEVFNQGNSPKSLTKFQQSAHQIYQRILAPLLDSIPAGQHLVIIPDGPLNLFPFEALLYSNKEESNGYTDLDYLIHHHQIQYALSADILLQGYTHKQSSFNFLGYAPKYEEARRLDYNEQEVEEIASLVSGQAITGTSANKSNFIQHANKARFLHLAQHAINEKDPLKSHLLFSETTDEERHRKAETSLLNQEDPRKLHAYEIYNQKFDCELAVLNACETGEGLMVQGEGMLSLSRAFRYAGAGSVIMNKWRVNDEASFHVLTEFYTQLKAGNNTAAALRKAKINYLQSSNKNHPYFWASAALIGNSISPEFKAKDISSSPGPDYWLFLGFWAIGILFLLGMAIKLSSRIV